MTIEPKVVANTNQIPGKAWLASQNEDKDKAVAECEYPARKKGVQIRAIYNWGRTYYYATFEGLEDFLGSFAK